MTAHVIRFYEHWDPKRRPVVARASSAMVIILPVTRIERFRMERFEEMIEMAIDAMPKARPRKKRRRRIHIRESGV